MKFPVQLAAVVIDTALTLREFGNNAGGVCQ